MSKKNLENELDEWIYENKEKYNISWKDFLPGRCIYIGYKRFQSDNKENKLSVAEQIESVIGWAGYGGLMEFCKSIEIIGIIWTNLIERNSMGDYFNEITANILFAGMYAFSSIITAKMVK